MAMNKSMILAALLWVLAASASHGMIGLDTLQSCICAGVPNQPYAVVARLLLRAIPLRW
jgi:hypothetical protein